MNGPAFGIGAYSPVEAAKLTGVPPSALRRWLFGYRYDHHGPTTIQAPLWQPEYGVEQDEPLLGFRDLIEARMVGNLRQIGIGMPTIRACLRTAVEIAEDEHPFSSASFRTDGKNLFLERVGDDGRHDVINLKSRQHQLSKVVERSFLGLEFDERKATRWFLMPQKQSIVADPERSFGQPIATDSGVPTTRLVQAVKAEGSIEKAAKLFETAVSVVRDALKFEAQLKVATVA